MKLIAISQLLSAPSWVTLFMDPNAPDIEGADDVAMNWVITGIVISVLVIGIMMAVKVTLKKRAPLQAKYWSFGKRAGFLFVGLFPLFLILLILYYLSLNFRMIVGVGGLFKGALFAWVIYAVGMVLGDLIVPAFRTDWSYRRG